MEFIKRRSENCGWCKRRARGNNDSVDVGLRDCDMGDISA